MVLEDTLEVSLRAILSHRTRSLLSMLGIAVGVAAVILLTSMGEGARLYLVEEFTQFGTNVVAINPGKSETIGIPGIFGGTTHKLTIDDAIALERIPGVIKTVPMVMGQARVEGGGRARSVAVYGSSSHMTEVFEFEIGQGSFLPPGDPRRGSSVAVLGPTLKRELFDDANALGEFVRIAGQRLRVIGVMKPKGRMLGFDIDDSVYVPVTTALAMFNLDELAEIDLAFAHRSLTRSVVEGARALLKERHGGREDVTITSQEAMLEVFDKVMGVVTAAVAAIGGISLLVGAIGVLTMMWISVNERVHEIGLMRALGATSSNVARIFLIEATLLTLLGGLLGVVGGLSIAALLRLLLPGMPVSTPLRYLAAALAVSVLTGLLAGVLPARRAASLDPVDALRAE